MGTSSLQASEFQLLKETSFQVIQKLDIHGIYPPEILHVACWKSTNLGQQFSPAFETSFCSGISQRLPWLITGGSRQDDKMIEQTTSIDLTGSWCLSLRVENRTSVLHVSTSLMGLTGWGGLGWGGVITFICTAWHTWCYAAVRLFALPHMHDATLLYVFLHVLTYMMLRCCTSSCTSSHIWCYASVRRLTLLHIHDATLLYVVLHFLTYMMLR